MEVCECSAHYGTLSPLVWELARLVWPTSVFPPSSFRKLGSFESSLVTVQYCFPKINHSLQLNSLELDCSFCCRPNLIFKKKNLQIDDFQMAKEPVGRKESPSKCLDALCKNSVPCVLFFFFLTLCFYVFITDFRFCPGLGKPSSWFVCVRTRKS